jgi:hypothetical protein
MSHHIKLPSPMYLPKGCHAYMYALGTVYARNQAEADAYASEHGLDDRSGNVVVMEADERAQMRAGLVDWLVAWEQGALSAEGEITLFQELVDSGLAWQLQGMYGRQAMAMLDAGLIHTGD